MGGGIRLNVNKQLKSAVVFLRKHIYLASPFVAVLILLSFWWAMFQTFRLENFVRSFLVNRLSVVIGDFAATIDL